MAGLLSSSARLLGFLDYQMLDLTNFIVHIYIHMCQ
jgi:hypothetical protein